jgi:uncharacterized membrane protein (UPF0182 family)
MSIPYTRAEGGAHQLIHRRFLYAVEFRDPQIFFTNYLTPESRIMYNRRIKRRVKTIAPFLSYDQDPYMVLSKGKLYWILDAYTTSAICIPTPREATAPLTGAS